MLCKHFPPNVLLSLFLILYVQSGVTPLWAASFNGHQKCVELLINAEANVDMQKKVKVKKLQVACFVQTSQKFCSVYNP